MAFQRNRLADRSVGIEAVVAGADIVLYHSFGQGWILNDTA
jgi:hypothetical protein